MRDAKREPSPKKATPKTPRKQKPKQPPQKTWEENFPTVTKTHQQWQAQS